MVGKLRPLGLALIAMIAAITVNAVAAAEASAEAGEFMAESYAAILDGSKVPKQPNALTIGPYEIDCEVSTFSGKLSEASSTLTVTPAYKNCQAAELPVTVTVNSCAYVFHLGEGKGLEWPTTVDVECPSEKEFEVHVFLDSEETTPVCTFKIPAQEGLTGAKFLVHKFTGELELEGKFEGIAYKTSGLCGEEEANDGVRDITAKFSGTAAQGGGPDGLRIE
jgi:hypothetical protein